MRACQKRPSILVKETYILGKETYYCTGIPEVCFFRSRSLSLREGRSVEGQAWRSRDRHGQDRQEEWTLAAPGCAHTHDIFACIHTYVRRQELHGFPPHTHLRRGHLGEGTSIHERVTFTIHIMYIDLRNLRALQGHFALFISVCPHVPP